jgi:acetyl esterase
MTISEARSVSLEDLREAERKVDGTTFTSHDIVIPLAGREVAARIYRPVDAGPAALPALVWFHGGGFALGSLESADGLCVGLCVRARCMVIAIDYRLAPEFPWPAAHDDALDSLHWIARHASHLGGDTQRLAVGGDSAGGHIAAMAAQKIELPEDVRLRAQVLFYPVISATMDTPSYHEFAEGFGLTRQDMKWFFDLAKVVSVGEQESFSLMPGIKHNGGPSTIILSAECDVLRDEAELYASALAQAGTHVTAFRYLGMPHGFAQMTAVTPVAANAIASAAAAVSIAWEG